MLQDKNNESGISTDACVFCNEGVPSWFRSVLGHRICLPCAEAAVEALGAYVDSFEEYELEA